MKKLYLPLFTLVATLLFTPLTHAFTDINDSPYKEEILILKELGIVNGDGGTGEIFNPDGLVTRGQLLKMAYLAQAKTTREIASNETPKDFPFNDLDSVALDPPAFEDLQDFRTNTNTPEWFEPFVTHAKNQGLVEGYEGNVFKPLQPVTFAEGAKIITQISGKYHEEKEGDWARSHIEALSLAGAIPKTITSDTQQLSREQAAKIIHDYILYRSVSFYGSQASANALQWNGSDYVAFEHVGSTGFHSFFKKDGLIYWVDSNQILSDPFTLLEDVDPLSFKVFYIPGQVKYNGELSDTQITFAKDDTAFFESASKQVNRIELATQGPLRFFEDSFFLGREKTTHAYAQDDENLYLFTCLVDCSVKLVDNVDLSSFEIIKNALTRDKDYFYYYSTPISISENGIDPETFSLAGRSLFKDKNHFYRLNEGEIQVLDLVGRSQALGLVEASKGFLGVEHFYLTDGQFIYFANGYDVGFFGLQIINDADVDSFQVLDNGLSQDQNQAYYLNYPIDLDVDLQSLEFLAYNLAKDGEDQAYYFDEPGKVEQFDYIGDVIYLKTQEHYLKDQEHIYVTPRYPNLLKKVEEADIETFNLISIQEGIEAIKIALDDSHLFWKGEVIEGSAGGTFTLLEEHPFLKQGNLFNVESYYAKDSQRVYFFTCYDFCTFEGILRESDASSFITFEGGLAADVNQIYYKGEVVPLELDYETLEYDAETQTLSDKNNQYTLEEIETVLEECAYEYAPVCGQLKEGEQGFRNSCLAKKAGAINVIDGLCTEQEKPWEQACLAEQGMWIPESNHCRGFDRGEDEEKTCTAMGGKDYYDCGSGCSPYSDSEVCPSVCVPICSF